MKHVFAVKDLAVQAFGPLITVRSQGEALRWFQDEVNNNNSTIHAHPADYELYRVGNYYDDTTGLVEPLAQAELTARAKDLSITKE